MSYFSDLDLRLRAAGIVPERVRLVPCDTCGQPQQIIGYEQGRIVGACRTVVCVERRRAARTAGGVA